MAGPEERRVVIDADEPLGEALESVAQAYGARLDRSTSAAGEEVYTLTMPLLGGKHMH